jgi:hypothetical protein
MQVSWLERSNLCQAVGDPTGLLVLDGDEPPSTSSTTPSSMARIMSAASRAARASMPVPMYGASARSSGTACFCMLAPMSARLASSCSRNGMSAVRDRHDLAGRDVHELDLFGATDEISVVAPKNSSALELQLQVRQRRRLRRAPHQHAVGLEGPSGLIGVLAWATTYSSSSSAGR